MPQQGTSGQGLPRAWQGRFAVHMPTRPLTTFAAALLAFAAAGCSPNLSSAAEPLAVGVVMDDTLGVQASAELRRPLTYDDRMGTALVAQLSTPLPVAGEHISRYRAGDVVYSDTEQAIIIFLSDGAAVPSGGLYRLGTVADGVDALAGCRSDCLVTFDRFAGAAGTPINSALPSVK